MLNILKNTPLSVYSTMRLGGTADYLVHIHSEADLLEALVFTKQKQIPYKVIGGGSNLIWPDEGFKGLVIVNAIQGIQIDGTTVTIQSGTNWDAAVQHTVDADLSGLEFLSLIPGSAGAVPVQNVGAYGAEVADTLVQVRAYDTHTKQFVQLTNADCQFGYRTSRFNTSDIGRFIITAVTFVLSTKTPQPPFYKALQEYLSLVSAPTFTKATVGRRDDNVPFTAQEIRAAVIAIRQSKLPDPTVTPNCGSFFKNPIINTSHCAELLKTYPTMPHWPQTDGVKIPAGWLVEQAGFKDYADTATGMATYKDHALVLVNQSAVTTAQLLQFTQKIIQSVQERFGIVLQQEPELVETD